MGSVSLMFYQHDNAMGNRSISVPGQWTSVHCHLGFYRWAGRRCRGIVRLTSQNPLLGFIQRSQKVACDCLPIYWILHPSASQLLTQVIFDRALLWIEIIGEYTRREFIHEEDKRVAIGVIAAQLGPAWEGSYVAGM